MSTTTCSEGKVLSVAAMRALFGDGGADMITDVDEEIVSRFMIALWV